MGITQGVTQQKAVSDMMDCSAAQYDHYADTVPSSLLPGKPQSTDGVLWQYYHIPDPKNPSAMWVATYGNVIFLIADLEGLDPTLDENSYPSASDYYSAWESQWDDILSQHAEAWATQLKGLVDTAAAS